jgi:hypothetical protein
MAELDEAGVRNKKVKKSLIEAQGELSRYRHATRYAIAKRQGRNKECRPSIS